jgi:hypothetical protein
MMRFPATAVLSFLLAQGVAHAGGENKVSWMKLDVAQQASSATGKPILVYSGFT